MLPTRRSLAPAWTVLLALALALPMTRADATTPAPTVRTFGVSMPTVPGDLAPLQSLTASLGRAPTTVMWYAAWSDVRDFPSAQAAAVDATGAMPVVTWEPWDPARGTRQPTYALKRIASGAQDTYVKRWATQAKAYGRPVVLRWAHEMNGSWYPWAAGVNGGTAADYVAAWRHLRDVFKAAGATNVLWEWSPNVPYAGSTALGSLYPGDAYVDRVALDGYNWSTLQAGSSWQSFGQVFGPGVSALQALAPTKPIYVAETASPEVGGDKAAWITDMFAWLAQHPEVRGFTWFDHQKETDWRLDSSPAALDAFRAGLATY